jgi:hypothetical protein
MVLDEAKRPKTSIRTQPAQEIGPEDVAGPVIGTVGKFIKPGRRAKIIQELLKRKKTGTELGKNVRRKSFVKKEIKKEIPKTEKRIKREKALDEASGLDIKQPRSGAKKGLKIQQAVQELVEKGLVSEKALPLVRVAKRRPRRKTDLPLAQEKKIRELMRESAMSGFEKPFEKAAKRGRMTRREAINILQKLEKESGKRRSKLMKEIRRQRADKARKKFKVVKDED